MFWHARVVSICLSMENSFKYELLWTKTLSDARVLIYTILSIYCLYIYMLIVSSIMWYLYFQLLWIRSLYQLVQNAHVCLLVLVDYCVKESCWPS